MPATDQQLAAAQAIEALPSQIYDNVSAVLRWSSHRGGCGCERCRRLRYVLAAAQRLRDEGTPRTLFGPAEGRRTPPSAYELEG